MTKNSKEVEVKPDAIAVIEQESNSILAEASKLKIKNESEYLAVIAFVKEVIRPTISKFDELFDPTISLLYKDHKKMVAEKKKHVRPLEQAEEITDKLIADWNTKKKLAAARESERIAAEQKRQLEEQIELERAERAQRLMDAGDEDGAVAAMDEVVEIPDSVLPPAVRVKPDLPTGTGVSVRQNYTAEVVDVYKLIEAVKRGVVPMNALAANESFLKAMARQVKNKAMFEAAYPGVKCVVTESVGVRD